MILWGLAAFFFLPSAVADVAHAVDADLVPLDGCPGYTATTVNVDGPRMSTRLVLAGKPCNVFGYDIEVLDLVVVYETGTLVVVEHLA